MFSIFNGKELTLMYMKNENDFCQQRSQIVDIVRSGLDKTLSGCKVVESDKIDEIS